MGLSPEERYQHFFSAMRQFRHSLVELEEGIKECQVSKRSSEMVKRWITTLDRLSGVVASEMNTNTAYWLIGPNTENFRSLYEESYGLAREETHSDPKSCSMQWYSDVGMSYLAKELTSGEFSRDYRNQVVAISLFWDAFAWTDAILYAVNRYKDEQFDCIKDELNALFGEMINTRYALMNSFESKPTNTQLRIEQVILCKYKLFRHRLNRAINSSENYEDTYEKQFNISPLVKEIGEMPLFRVEKELEDIESSQYEKDQSNYQQNEKPCGVFGPAPREYNDLEKIMDVTDSKEEYERCELELEKAWGKSRWNFDNELKRREKEKANANS